jgi:hypothetical protein
MASSILSFVRERWAMREISASVLLREETKNMTGSIAAKNTAQNKNIFLYGSGFFAGGGIGVVTRVSIYLLSVSYFLGQCKHLKPYKTGFTKYFLENYSSFQRKSQFKPKNSQTEERLSCENMNIRGIVIVLIRVRSDQRRQNMSGISQFPPPTEDVKLRLY